MPTTRFNVSWKNIEKKIAEGRGQGEGANYTPWYFVHEVPSHGRSHVLQGYKENRTCHLLSDLEYHAWLIAEASPVVIETREQFVLLPVEETVDIAAEMGVKHPTFPRTHTLSPVTTDLLLTVQRKLQVTFEAVAVKPSKHLSQKRVLEKLEIERRYWERRQINWHVATELEFPKAVITNLKKMSMHIDLSDYGLPDDLVHDLSGILTQEILVHEGPLIRLTKKVDQNNGLRPGASLAVVYHLIATGQWGVDLKQPIQSCLPLGLVHTTMRRES